MPGRVPELPTTSHLREQYPQTGEQFEFVLEQRGSVSIKLGERASGLLVVLGPCGITEEAVYEGVTEHEVQTITEINTADPDNEWLYRMPDYKPRTDPTQWHGLITSNPGLAYQTLTKLSNRGGSLAMEISTDPRHLDRNAPHLTLGWKGGRSEDEVELTDALALYDPQLPIAVKNGLSGEIDTALADVIRIEQLRGGLGARAVLLYRGGANAKTPEAWEEHYLDAHERTEGRLLVDLAHGTEMAHDPAGIFGKSTEGQEIAAEHLVAIIDRTGRAPAGIFMEASDHKGRTDPNIRFAKGIEIGRQVIEAANASVKQAA